jgi:UDP-galactopyranose mutase
MAARFLIIGAGFSGTVLAHQLVRALPCTVEIWEERDHIGGNCHTERDPETGVMVHHYGPHIFHTNREDVWQFVNELGRFRPYVHRVKTQVGEQVYSLPINLQTLNQFFGVQLTPATAPAFLAQRADASIQQPANFEEQALAFVGPELYQAFFYGYTKKQWGVEPRELPASILRRLPVRFSYDDNYHPSTYTGIPEGGYSALIEKLIDHPAISVSLQKRFSPSETSLADYDHVFFTGPLDAFFQFQFGRLGYRSIRFDTHRAVGDFQGCTQMNFGAENVPYTRITEHKHFTPWEKHDQTIYFVEYSYETGEADLPYYPKRLWADKEKLMQYRQLAEQQQHVSFLGRLATYRYLDMHQVIGEALDFAAATVAAIQAGTPIPVFPNPEP